MWGHYSVDNQIPSNASTANAQPVLHRRHSSEEVKFSHDAPLDFGIVESAGMKEVPTGIFWAESSNTREMPVLIDNTSLVYVEVKLSCGIRAMCTPEVLSRAPMILRSLQTDTNSLLKVLPVSVHGLVRRTTIWVNETYAYGSRDDPRVLRHSTAHHSEGWLVHCARDIPEKARGIEIYNCHDYERMRLHWNGCGLLLHEFCHLVHQSVLDLDNETVKDLYETARYSERYDKTLRRDWAGLDEDYDMGEY